MVGNLLSQGCLKQISSQKEYLEDGCGWEIKIVYGGCCGEGLFWRASVLVETQSWETERLGELSDYCVLFSACETWCATKSPARTLQTFVDRCLGHILHIKWQDRVTKEEV